MITNNPDPVKNYRENALFIELLMYKVDPNILPPRLQTVERPEPLFDNQVVSREDSKPCNDNLNENPVYSLENRMPKEPRKIIDYTTLFDQDRKEYRRDLGLEIIDLGKLVELGGEIAVCPVDHMSSDPSVRRIVYRTAKGKPIQEAYVRLSGNPDGGFRNDPDDGGPGDQTMNMVMMRMHLGE